jgi:hypothetical protein
MFVAIFEREVGDAGFVEVADAFIAVHSAPVALREEFSMSAFSNQHCTTSPNESPRPKSCEN